MVTLVTVKIDGLRHNLSDYPYNNPGTVYVRDILDFDFGSVPAGYFNSGEANENLKMQTDRGKGFIFTVPEDHWWATTCHIEDSNPEDMVLGMYAPIITIEVKATVDAGEYVDIFNIQDSDYLEVDWGEPDNEAEAEHEHTYSSAGTYDVVIKAIANEIALGGDWVSEADLIVCPRNAVGRFPEINIMNNFFRWASLATVPSDIFNYMEQVVSFYRTFASSSIESIPSNLFSNLPEAYDFGKCFNHCHSLTSISGSTFSGVPKASDFYYCFGAADQLTSIPAGLFSGTKGTNFHGCFTSCQKLDTIGNGIFDNMDSGSWASFEYCFAYTAITSLPSGLFQEIEDVTEDAFRWTFDSCYNLASIPGNLFGYINTDSLSFQHCFRDCSSLSSLPSGLFGDIHVSDVLTFADCFRGTDLSNGIPFDLFRDYSVNEIRFGCFQETNLPSAPSGLFSGISGGDLYFGHTFENLKSLEYIPDDLFKNLGAYDKLSFYATFSDCVNLDCMAPPLWEWYPDAFSSSCFENCTSLDNYNDIPDDWK